MRSRAEIPARRTLAVALALAWVLAGGPARAVCPKTGQPDFGVLTVRYVADAQCIELKSLKLYLQEYRNRGIFYEAAVNAILDDLVEACRPRVMELEGAFSARGGITTTVTAEYFADPDEGTAD